jgi:hypothetical protein
VQTARIKCSRRFSQSGHDAAQFEQTLPLQMLLLLPLPLPLPLPLHARRDKTRGVHPSARPLALLPKSLALLGPLRVVYV